MSSDVTKPFTLISNFEELLKALSLTTLTDRIQREDAIQMYIFVHEIDEIRKENRFQVI